jgi:hypothetical protein
MKSYQLFEAMPAGLAGEILGYIQREQSPVFKSVVQSLASQRKLRPVFIERKPPAERYDWIRAALSRKPNDTLAAHLLQGWLLGARKEMLCDFLDSLGIKHEDDGTVEQLPDSPAPEELRQAIALLLGKFPRELVALYLHAFHDMDSSVTWPPLGEILAQDERLRVFQGASHDRPA